MTTAGVILVARGDGVGDESKTSRGFVLGFGIGGVVGGGLGLFLKTPYERLTVRDAVELGRTPHLGALRPFLAIPHLLMMWALGVAWSFVTMTQVSGKRLGTVGLLKANAMATSTGSAVPLFA